MENYAISNKYKMFIKVHDKEYNTDVLNPTEYCIVSCTFPFLLYETHGLKSVLMVQSLST